MIVEDSVDTAEILCLILQRSEHEVHCAYDGPAAIELARQKELDVVLLDIGLPHMDGYEVAQKLRQGPGGAQLQLVAITGYGGAEEIQRIRAAGCDHYLRKPIALADLKALLSSALAKKTGAPVAAAQIPIAKPQTA
ncbi:MAG TPA: response regulator [Pseudomonadota bacterium]|nr:response regulator [Pseudomonadota bacterium]